MSILASELKAYGCATMPDDDSTTEIGGAIDTAKKIEFYDVGGAIQIVSSDSGDTSQTITVSYKDAGGNIQTEVKTLSGLTPVGYVATPERLLKAIKSATCAGWVAVEAATGERAGTAQGGGAETITLDAGASAVTDYYVGMVIRLTSGTGSGQIRQVIKYNGTTKVATINAVWGVNPDATSVFRMAKGMVFDKTPHEVTQCRRLFYNAGADPAGGSDKEVHDKFFFKNTNATLALTSARVIQSADPSGLVTHALAATKGDTGTNGSGNSRLVAPAGLTFNDTDKAVPTGSLAAGETIGAWGKLTLANGAAAQNTYYMPQLIGNTT